MCTEEKRYSALIKARAPESLRLAVERAASLELTTASTFVRKAILNQLRADGISVQPSNQEAA
jgi:hypothetical protein